MNEIIPSTKLRIITVHKLWDMSCLRYYFWRWILNLEPRKINLNFWYGGVLGAGFEAVLLGKSVKQAFAVMKVESKKRLSRHLLVPDDEAEVRLQMELIKLFIEMATKSPHPKFNTKKMHLTSSQVKVKFQLKHSPVWFLGTLDGTGTYRNKPYMFETKTARTVNNDYITVLSYDKQIHSYALGLKKTGRECPSKCCYCIFRKVQRRIKRNQTIDEFIEEIKQDLVIRAPWYFIMHEQTLGHLTLTQTEQDIERQTQILHGLYRRLPTRRFLDPQSWPKQDKQCLNYGACPFLLLCRNPLRWKLQTKLYQQREMMYKEEKEELIQPS